MTPKIFAFMDELDKIASKNVRHQREMAAAAFSPMFASHRSYVEGKTGMKYVGLLGKGDERMKSIGRSLKKQVNEDLERSREVVKLAVSEEWITKKVMSGASKIRPTRRPKVLGEFAERNRTRGLLMRGKNPILPDYVYGMVKDPAAERASRENTWRRANKRFHASDLAYGIADKHVKLGFARLTSTVAEMEKEAYLRDLKDVAGQAWKAMRQAPAAAAAFARKVPGHLQGAADNVGSAVGGFARPVDSFRTGWQRTVRDTSQMSSPMKALMGAGLALGVHDVALREDPSGMGRSRLHRSLRFAGDQAGMIMGAPYGFSGGVAASLLGGKLGDLAGRAVDKARGYKPQPLAPPQG